jgi:hypothetical protein
MNTMITAASLLAVFALGACVDDAGEDPAAAQVSALNDSSGRFVLQDPWTLMYGLCREPGQILGHGDFDGDGKQDLYCHDAPGTSAFGETMIVLSTGSDFAGLPIGLMGWCMHTGSTIGTGDFNSDGKTDLYCHDVGTNGRGGNTWVAISTGTDFSLTGAWMSGWCADPGATFATGDFNGDRRTDFYCHDAQGTPGGKTMIELSTGSGLTGGNAWLSGWCSHVGATFATGDFDGNGRTDFYCHDFLGGSNKGNTWVALSTGSGFATSPTWLSGWCSHAGAVFGVGDFDGNNKSDVYCHDFAEGNNSGTTWTTLSTGSGFSGGSVLNGFCAQPGATFGTGDFDGNRSADFYCHDPIGAGSSGNTAVELSTGRSFVDGSSWLSGWCGHPGSRFGTGDFDGDGRTDLYCNDPSLIDVDANVTSLAFARP